MLDTQINIHLDFILFYPLLSQILYINQNGSNTALKCMLFTSYFKWKWSLHYCQFKFNFEFSIDLSTLIMSCFLHSVFHYLAVTIGFIITI